ncbi:MAG: sigma 54-interacting transcriptional regulator [Pseudomonadota bacterium]
MENSSFELFKTFAGELDPELLQKRFLTSLLKLQNVQRGSIWIKQGESYQCIEAAGMESDAVRGVCIDAGKPSIVGWVIENRKMTVADTRKDGRHYKELEENMAVKSSLIICFPLFLNPEEVYGAVEIIDTSPGKQHVNLDQGYLSTLQNLVDIGSVALGNAFLYSKQLKEKQFLESALRDLRGDRIIVGNSPAFLRCMDRVRSYAASDFHVLITGESGTGKELIAQEIHRLGVRKTRPLLIQNCSAIPETLLASELFGYKRGAFSGAVKDKIGLFEAADGGTVFLDEIGEMPLALQASILRVIQSNEIKPLGQNRVKHVDVRVITATNRDIRQMASDGRFRQDLFYRLSVLPIHVPPLRERPGDIPLLATYFLRQESIRAGVMEKKIRPGDLHRLMTWSWPGNIRELENLVKYLTVISRGDYMDTAAISSYFDAPGTGPGNFSGAVSGPGPGIGTDSEKLPGAREKSGFGDRTWMDIESAYVRYLLRRHGWNMSRAARAAGINRSTFVSRMNRLGISRDEFLSPPE